MSLPADNSGFVTRLRSKINRGDSWLSYDLARLLPGDKIDDAALEEFEDLLIQADIGVAGSQHIVEHLRAEVLSGRIRKPAQLVAGLETSLLRLLAP